MELYDKFMGIITSDLADFEKKLLAGSVADAVDRAYELVIKQELVSFCESNENVISRWVTNDILNTPALLDWMYSIWLKYEDSIQESFFGFIEYLSEYAPPTNIF